MTITKLIFKDDSIKLVRWRLKSKVSLTDLFKYGTDMDWVLSYVEKHRSMGSLQAVEIE